MRQLQNFKRCKKLRNQERRKYFVTALDGQIHDMIATVMLVPHNIYFTILLSCLLFLLVILWASEFLTHLRNKEIYYEMARLRKCSVCECRFARESAVLRIMGVLVGGAE